ncbi:MAG: DUF952 domain-containing protein [Candidatus Dormibacteria bacterium]
MDTTPHIFHVARRAKWEAAQATGEYRQSTLDSTLEEIGYIHCSFEHQLAAVAAKHYRGQRDLVLLEIDPWLVGADIRDENTSGGEELYPHIYGALEITAVVRASDLDPPSAP